MDLSVAKVVGSALASIVAAVIASMFSVEGTLIGAAAMSAIATVATALATHSVSTAQQRVRTLRERRGGTHTAPTPLSLERFRNIQWNRIRWPQVAVATVLTFGLAVGAITLFESVSGEPVAASVGGSKQDGQGTSIGRVLGGQDRRAEEPPDTVPTPAPPSTTGLDSGEESPDTTVEDGEDGSSDGTTEPTVTDPDAPGTHSDTDEFQQDSGADGSDGGSGSDSGVTTTTPE
jgi:hypothetical protein